MLGDRQTAAVEAGEVRVGLRLEPVDRGDDLGDGRRVEDVGNDEVAIAVERGHLLGGEATKRSGAVLPCESDVPRVQREHASHHASPVGAIDVRHPIGGCGDHPAHHPSGRLSALGGCAHRDVVPHPRTRRPPCTNRSSSSTSSPEIITPGSSPTLKRTDALGTRPPAPAPPPVVGCVAGRGADHAGAKRGSSPLTDSLRRIERSATTLPRWTSIYGSGLAVSDPPRAHGPQRPRRGARAARRSARRARTRRGRCDRSTLHRRRVERGVRQSTAAGRGDRNTSRQDRGPRRDRGPRCPRSRLRPMDRPPQADRDRRVRQPRRGARRRAVDHVHGARHRRLRCPRRPSPR